mgnify:CR=1 FL=1
MSFPRDKPFRAMSQGVRLKCQIKILSLKQNLELRARDRKTNKNYRKRSEKHHQITLVY